MSDSWLALLTLLMIPTAQADFHIMELKELSLDYKNFAVLNDKARDLLIYPDHPKEGIDIIMNTKILEYGYMDATVESLTNDSQYAGIGLQMHLGLQLGDTLRVGYYHHSQHTLDRPSSYMDRYASEDALEVKIWLYKAKD